ncbi:aldo/keto reductase-like diketogulonate reductase [Marinobacter santoriniensis NKSG1]|uniref:Aldo/keto reductase-like diketogulonate reductase n=1 Tax=Marinobacter santoriniensis NKSG1 TaxID=1288826 RepID=M7DHW3_9GAMM|nr:aldo/keto reductase [Marinobacter santoriniensis]EMP57267.1 aldo/keto reductase-like diketogulonate reductase [Marinobacter santoriniensis NKSG1]
MVRLSRRRFLIGAGLGSLALVSSPLLAGKVAAPGDAPQARPIPSTGEHLPAIGMGTWITFNVGSDQRLVDQRTRVLETFLERGGSVIDCSPMYGSSADVVGAALETLDARDRIFAASKIWTGDGSETREQAASSARRWGIPRFDLLQVHNLLSWQEHLATLKDMKARGDVRYLGITTSHGRRHDELARVIETEDLDFVQLTYNVLDREAEKRLLPLAHERGVAVIVNRPFQGGSLFRRFQSEPLPNWAGEAGIETWAAFFLKFIISHPAVTCAIPATTRIDHMRENMAAMYGTLPDAGQRRMMAEYVRQL